MTIELEWVAPAACSLPTADQPLRVAEFDAFFASHLMGAERVDDTHARLVLTATRDAAEQAQSLAERESSCCSFFTFSITSGPEGVCMDIVVPPEYVPVLDALVARAESMRRGTQP